MDGSAPRADHRYTEIRMDEDKNGPDGGGWSDSILIRTTDIHKSGLCPPNSEILGQ